MFLNVMLKKKFTEILGNIVYVPPCLPGSGTGWPPPAGCRPAGPAQTACCPVPAPTHTQTHTHIEVISLLSIQIRINPTNFSVEFKDWSQ